MVKPYESSSEDELQPNVNPPPISSSSPRFSSSSNNQINSSNKGEKESSVEAFDRYLEQDLRVGEFPIDVPTLRELIEVNDKVKKWKYKATILNGAFEVASRNFKNIWKNVELPPKAGYYFIPLLGYIFVHQAELGASFAHRIPCYLPGTSMILKRPNLVDWGTVDGTDFFTSIDWDNVYYSNYQFDSSCVSLMPNYNGKQAGRYIAGVRVPFNVKEKSGRVITLKPDAFGQFRVPPKMTKKQQLTKKKKTKKADWLQKNKHEKKIYSSSPVNQINRQRKPKTALVTSSSRVKKDVPLYAVRQKLGSLKDNQFIQKKKRLPLLLQRQKAKKKAKLFFLDEHRLSPEKKVFVLTSSKPKPKGLFKLFAKWNRIKVKKESIYLKRSSPLIMQTVRRRLVKTQHIDKVQNPKNWMFLLRRFSPFRYLITPHNYHLLHNERIVLNTHKLLQKRWLKKKPISVLKKQRKGLSIESQYYWQTFFQSLDLLPLKMESVFQTNDSLPSIRKVRLYKDRQQRRNRKYKSRRSRYKKRRKKPLKRYLRNYGEAIFDHELGLYRDLFDYQACPTLARGIDIIKRREIADQSFMYRYADRQTVDRIKTPKVLIKKDALLGPNGPTRRTFFKKGNLNYRMYRVFQRRDRNKLKKNKKWRRRQRKLELHHQYKATQPDYRRVTGIYESSAPPLFSIQSKKIKPAPLQTRKFKWARPTRLKIDKQMTSDVIRSSPPKTKIDELSHGIQLELTRALSPEISSSQKPRYLINDNLLLFSLILNDQINTPIPVKKHTTVWKKHQAVNDDSHPLDFMLHKRAAKASSEPRLKTYKHIKLDEARLFLALNEDAGIFKTTLSDRKVRFGIPDPPKKKYSRFNIFVSFHDLHARVRRPSFLHPPAKTSHIKPILNRFGLKKNRYQKYKKDQMYNKYEILPITHKHWFEELRNKFKSDYSVYQKFYEKMFLSTSIQAQSANWLLDDIIETEEEKKDYPGKTSYEKYLLSFQQFQRATVLRNENNKELKRKEYAEQFAAEVEAFKDGLSEAEFVDNLTNFLTHKTVDKTNTKINQGTLTKNSMTHKITGLKTRALVEQSIEDQLQFNKNLIERYSIKTHKKHKDCLSKTKYHIRKKVVIGYSPFTERKLSGYLNPDASFKDKYSEMLSWENVFQNSKHVYSLNRKNPHLYKLNFSKTKTNHTLFRFNGVNIQKNYENFLRLTAVPYNKGPYNFKAFSHGTAKHANPFKMPDQMNYFGHTEPNYGAVYFKDRKGEAERRRRREKLKRDEVPYKLNKQATRKIKKQRPCDESSVPHPYWNARFGRGLKYKREWVKRNLPARYIASMKDYRGFQMKYFEPTKKDLTSKSLHHSTKHSPSIARFEHLLKTDPGNGMRSLISYDPLSVAVQNPKMNLKGIRPEGNDRTFYCYRVQPMTNPRYITLAIAAYVLVKEIKRIYKEYAISISNTFTKFMETLDLEALHYLNNVGRAVIPPPDVRFSEIVGGDKVFDFMYPAIVSLQAEAFLLNNWKMTPLEALQSLACSKFNLKLGSTQRNAVSIALERIAETDEEKARKIAIRLQVARHAETFAGDQTGFLLVGPPGTGKTFLVKALAGECGVPVILPSRYKAEVKEDPSYDMPAEAELNGVLKIQQLFNLAESRHPAILFLDEIDTLGPDRKDVKHSSNVLADPNFENPMVDCMVNINYLESPLVHKKSFAIWKNNILTNADTLDLDQVSQPYLRVYNPYMRSFKLKQRTKKQIRMIGQPELDVAESDMLSPESLSTLTQLLCSLDGVKVSKTVVLGATNRPAALDPALTRPGRLSKVLYLDLPKAKKRLDLLKFYSGQNIDADIHWEHFNKQTLGLSPAHLKVAANFSAFKNAFDAIQKEKAPRKNLPHTQKTIDYGIQAIKDNKTFHKAYIKRSKNKLNKFGLNFGFGSIHLIQRWKHVSLGLPTHPVQCSSSNLPALAIKETYPSNSTTQVWNSLPNFMPVVSFHQLYHHANVLVIQPIDQNTKQKNVPIKKPSHPDDKLSDLKKQRRAAFYQKHRKKLRKAYLFSDPKTINYSLLKNKQMSDHPFIDGFYNSSLLDRASATILEDFKDYVNRVFKVHLFSSKLLLNTSLFPKNPLSFSLRHIYNKKQIVAKSSQSDLVNRFAPDKTHTVLIRSKAQFIQFTGQNTLILKLLNPPVKDETKRSPTQPSMTLFVSPDHLSPKLEKMFNHKLALHRSLFYNVSKAMMVHFLTEESYEQIHAYDLWSRMKYDLNPDEYQKIFMKIVKANFNVRKDFENYLLSLIAGKVGEHLMLLYRDELPKFDPLKPRTGRYTYDVSEIGQEELHQITWLLKIMIEKNVFYTADTDLTKQVYIGENKCRENTTIDNTPEPIRTDRGRWDTFDRKTSRLLTKFEKNPFVKATEKLLSSSSKGSRNYWWQLQGLDNEKTELELPKNTLNDWVPLFYPTPVERYRVPPHPVEFDYDIYRPNVLQTEFLLDQPFDPNYLPTTFVNQVMQSTSEPWNRHQLSANEHLSRVILLEAFAKTFYILSAQRELSDLLSYSLLLKGKVPANTMKKISANFLQRQKQEAERIQQQIQQESQSTPVDKKETND